MRTNILSHLVYPKCQTEFLFSVIKKTKERIVEGELKCKKCGTRFYIKDEVAYFVPCGKKQFEKDVQGSRKITIEQERYKKPLVAIKEKQVPMVGFRAGQVCERVFNALKDKMPTGWKFNPSSHHVRCWRYFKVRPPKNSPDPAKTNQSYCFYNSAFNQYEYTEKWIKFLINKLKNKETYKKVMGIK